jgi:hypothetical protein
MLDYRHDGQLGTQAMLLGDQDRQHSYYIMKVHLIIISRA